MILRQPGPASQRPLSLETVADPTPGDDELLLRVRACGVCRTDLHEVEGELPMRREWVIPGHEVVGEVVAVGANATRHKRGDRVGGAWVHRTCGTCSYCRSDKENLCSSAAFSGWTVNGGYAEYVVVPEAFAYSIPDSFPDNQAAPLLCAGIIGYRALRLSGIRPGQRLGLYGFGAAAHIAIQVARYLGCENYVFTRSEANRELGLRLGAVWAGDSQGQAPASMHASIIFAPAGPIVLDALDAVDKGGTVVLAGIHMSPIPQMDYRRHLYDEKCLRSVANATRRDAEELLRLAGEIPIQTEVKTFPLDQANEALAALKEGRVRGAAVLVP
jgi:alcohol dehydrogenase, propanol-preferring